MPSQDQDRIDNLSRAVGQLEGRQSSIEGRMDRHEQVTQRVLGELGTKLDNIGEAIEDIRNEQSNRDGQIKGGTKVIIVLWTVGAAIASLFVAVWKYILHAP